MKVLNLDDLAPTAVVKVAKGAWPVLAPGELAPRDRARLERLRHVPDGPDRQRAIVEIIAPGLPAKQLSPEQIDRLLALYAERFLGGE